MATIKDIARESGVSESSVSNVLNSTGRVGPETRERVLKTMRELGYRPSPLFRHKHREQNHTIGVMFMHVGIHSLSDHPYFILLLDGILSVTTPSNWDLLMLTTPVVADVQKRVRAKFDGRCDGLVLMGLPVGDELISVLRERGIPFVAINNAAGLIDVSSVDVDNAQAASDATNYLIRLGHRRIALLSGNLEFPNTGEREQGFQQACEVAGMNPNDCYIVPGHYTDDSGYKRAKKLFLSQEPRPTALFCGNDRIAQGVYRAASEVGISIPDQLSVIGFDDLPYAAGMTPPLTTVRQPLPELGRAATEILIAQVSDGVSSVRKQTYHAELIERSSCAPPSL